MKNIKSYRFVTWILLLIICLPGCGPDHGPAASTCMGGMGVEPPEAMSAWRLADMYRQLRISTETPVKADTAAKDGGGGGAVALECIGLGLETISLGLDIWHVFHESAQFEAINNRLDKIDQKLDVIKGKLDQVQRLLVEGLDALSIQLEVNFTDLKSFIADKAIQDPISIIKTYAFTTGPSGLYWLCAKDRIKNTPEDQMRHDIERWQNALQVGGPDNIEVVLGKIYQQMTPDLYGKRAQSTKGALETYADYLIALLNQAKSKDKMSYEALVKAYLSYERYYSAILYWEHVGAALHTELYNSLKNKSDAFNYLNGTFKSNITEQNKRFFQNGLRLVAAFSSYLPKSPVGTSCYGRSVILRDQQQLLARLGFFVASYNGYEAYGDKGRVRHAQRIVFVRGDLLTTTTPWLALGEPNHYMYPQNTSPCATVSMGGDIYNVFFYNFFPDVGIEEYFFESANLVISGSDYRNMRCGSGTNGTFDATLSETLGFYNWNYTTDCLDTNHVFLNRNFIIIDN